MTLRAALLTGLKYVAVIVFMVMGARWIMVRVDILWARDKLSKAGLLPRFVAGLLVIIVNPKAIKLEIGVLPGIFDVTCVTTLGISVVCQISAAITLFGNIILGAMLDLASLLIAS